MTPPIKRALVTLTLATCSIRAAEPVKFGRDVLPILSANCIACHGPDEKDRKAKLRLDIEFDAKAKHEDGLPISSGHPEKSTVIARLVSTDPDEVMPPAKSHKTVKPEQIETLRRWISEGATWGKHWSFEPLTKPVVAGDAKRRPIDVLVSDELQRHGLKLQTQAGPHELMRRISLDIIGLPPTPETADRFAADASLEDYERIVDELLKSPQFGEHWARVWLDLARYADTKGYEKDLGRTIWPYRDWVVNALNADVPLDQFTREQLAGDLLPNPTEQQLIATAFHRNTMNNDEGGTDNEEFRQVAVKDRIDTTIQVWMGLTMGCAKCHSHKYDPITNEDYYRFYGLFNQTEDADLPSDAPLFSKPTPEQKTKVDAANAKQKEIVQRLNLARKDDPRASKQNTPQPEDSPAIAKIKTELKTSQDEVKAINDQIVSVPIMRELAKNKQRITKIHKRGNFLDQGDPVTPALLPAFHKMPEGTPLNRLGVAEWLVNKDNPMTPRVWANRVWARLFGIGIVETEEDFGALGAAPTNPLLLDWLAAEYRDGGWSLKKLIKTIVMSATYRQSSLITPALREADPRNQLMSRGARYRLSAEAVRDQALAVSGLLSLKMGGPPVMPPQPDGLWRSTYNGKKWINAEDEDRDRRGLYTYLKRTTPYPSMTTFDGGSGEVCQIRRIRTNTPLQALVTLNDPVFLEASAALAGRMIGDASSMPTRIARGLQLALIRPAHPEELKLMMQLLQETEKDFTASPAKAEDLIKTTRAKVPTSMSKPAFAAWIVTASTILNLDEFLTRN